MNNYLIARWHQFLIVQHLRTLFSPWHRQNPSDFGKKEKMFVDKVLDGVADTYIRLIAAGIRLMIILSGLVVGLFTAIGFLILFVIWLGWPIISIYLVIKGVMLLI